MPDKEELEIRLMDAERSFKEFPDPIEWRSLKEEIEAQYAPEPEEVADGENR